MNVYAAASAIAALIAAMFTAVVSRRTGRESHQISLIDKSQSLMEANLNHALTRITYLEAENAKCVAERQKQADEIRELRSELVHAMLRNPPR
jgi:hypothetical protein